MVHKIDEMFAFIVTEDDGSEGIPAVEMGGMAFPLVGADIERIDSLRYLMEGFDKPVTIARFTNRINVEVMNKGEKDENAGVDVP
jgi:hypothetical protein